MHMHMHNMHTMHIHMHMHMHTTPMAIYVNHRSHIWMYFDITWHVNVRNIYALRRYF